MANGGMMFLLNDMGPLHAKTMIFVLAGRWGVSRGFYMCIHL
jgi:hypothetical protein